MAAVTCNSVIIKVIIIVIIKGWFCVTNINEYAKFRILIEKDSGFLLKKRTKRNKTYLANALSPV